MTNDRNMILQLGINSALISATLTTFLRIKNLKEHKRIIKKISENNQLPNITTAYGYLEKLMVDNPQISYSPAIIQNRTVTYAELKKEIDATFKFLHFKLGCKKGDNISICAASSIEGIIAFFAMNKIGAVNARIFNGSKEEKFKDNLIGFKSKIILTDKKNYKTLTNIIDETYIRTIILMDSKDDKATDYNGVKIYSWKQVIDCGAQLKDTYDEIVNCEDRAAILYTSGSSGEPKPISILNRSYVNMVDVVCSTTGIKKCDGEKVVGVVSHEYPYAAINCTIMILLMGKTLIMPEHNESGALDFDALMAYKPNRIQAIPNFYKLMQEKLDKGDLKFDYLSTVVSGGETYLTPEKIKLISFLRKHNCRALLIDGFGFGELGSATALKFGSNPYFLLMNGIRAKSVHPETGETLGLDEEGILCITGPTIAEGYYNDEESTNKAFIRDSEGVVWFHSDTYGLVHGNDRRRIKLGGRVREYFITDDGQGNFVKVYAGRVEDVISSLECIADCIVVPSDRNATPRSVVFVRLQNDCVLTDEEVISKMQNKCLELESFARPIDFIFEKVIVRTNAGKKDYRFYEEKYNQLNKKPVPLTMQEKIK